MGLAYMYVYIYIYTYDIYIYMGTYVHICIYIYTYTDLIRPSCFIFYRSFNTLKIRARQIGKRKHAHDM